MVAQANPEDGNLAEQLADRINGVSHGSRIARPVGEKYAVWLKAHHLASGCGRRDYRHAEASRGQQPKLVVLDPEIIGDDVPIHLASRRADIPCWIDRLFPDVRLAA